MDEISTLGPFETQVFFFLFFSFNDANALWLQKNGFSSSELLPNYRGAVTDGWRKKANICPVCGKKKRKSASQKQIFGFFPPTTSRFLVWIQLLGKKRASANPSFFFLKLSRVSNCWLEEKSKYLHLSIETHLQQHPESLFGPNLRRTAKENGFCSSELFPNHHWRPVWKKTDLPITDLYHKWLKLAAVVFHREGGRGGVSDQWGACCGKSPPPVASSEMRRHACPHPLPTVTPPSWPLITIGL